VGAKSNDSQKKPAQDPKKSPLGKIKIELPNASSSSASSSCPFHNWFYIAVALFALSYAVYLQDRQGWKSTAEGWGLGGVTTVFYIIETYSPFNEFLESDEEFLAKVRKEETRLKAETGGESKDHGQRVFTKSELVQYTGAEGTPGLYLAFLGVVYDVGKGAQYYGEGGGYSFFAARDASRAFVTGNFEQPGLVEDVSGLSGSDYLGLEEWQGFYEKDYTRVGVLDGHFYSSSGEPTARWIELQGWIAEAKEERDKQDVEKQMFPPCNAEWTQADGSRFWCTKKSGGVTRNWVGLPRQLFYPGREPRCACVRSSGAPSTDPGDRRADRGDLDNPHLKEYQGCPSDSPECRHKE